MAAVARFCSVFPLLDIVTGNCYQHVNTEDGSPMSMPLKKIVSHLLDRMAERRQLHALDARTRPALDEALESVIEGTDTKIRLVPNYRERLYHAILRSLDYVDHLINKIPDAIELDGHRFTTDPCIRAFFPTLEGMRKVCHQSSELRDYFSEPEYRNKSESCVLLCMEKKEQRVLGMELKDDRVIRDVAQIRVSFSGHHIYSPADSEANARRELKCCLYEGLVNNALDKISALRMQRYQLETRQHILHTRLRERRNKGGSGQDRRSEQEIREELMRVEGELQAMGYVTPEVCLEIVKETLSRPEAFVSLEVEDLKLCKSGLKPSADDSSEEVFDLVFSEVRIKGEKPRVVTLAKIHREDAGV